MANLEVINYTPMQEIIEGDSIQWVRDRLAHPISKLPQIFWSNGEPWHEANHWAITKATSTLGGHIKTVTSAMKHLAAYASWLESVMLDWRHFPMRMEHRAIVQYRAELIKQRDRGSLAPSTVHERMASVIRFYRHANIYGFVERDSPMWQDRLAVIPYFDVVGFKRTLTVLSSELAIPNRKRHGLILENGLTPLRYEDAMRLREFVRDEGLHEIYLMLSLGIFTGARIETITTLGVKNVEEAHLDVQSPDIYWISVGPGTGVKTKFDVSGKLMVPRFLIEELKNHAYSMQRIRRQALASVANRGLLFLTIRGNPYQSGSFTRLMTDLRRRALDAGLRFLDSFKFHQTRATFGTHAMSTALQTTSVANAVAFVRDVMLHKDEKVTMQYVRFNQEAPVKAKLANEFSAMFTGVVNRDWSKSHA